MLATVLIVYLQSLFPQDLVDHEQIRAQFTLALSMNHAVEGRSVPAWQQAHEPHATSSQSSSYNAYAAPAAAPGPALHAPGQYMAAAEDLTLRQLVESYAAENDIQLLPKAGQMEEGLQVCRLRVHVVILPFERKERYEKNMALGVIKGASGLGSSEIFALSTCSLA